MDVKIKDAVLAQAAGEGMDAFLTAILSAIKEVVGDELNASSMQQLTADQITLWGYMTLRDELIIYCDAILSGKIAACQKHKWACLRLLSDFKREGTKLFPYVFDEENKNKILQHAALLGENYYNEVKNKEIPYYSKFGNGGLRDLNRVYFITNQLENIIFICFFILGIVIYSILCIHYCLPKNQNVKINQ
jgi:hypothetical protein